MKLSEVDIAKREALKGVMAHGLFAQALEDIRVEMGRLVLKSNDPQERERLVLEASLLNRLQSRLDSYVSDLLFLKTTQEPTDEAA